MNQLIFEIGRVTGRRVRFLPKAADHGVRLAVDRLYRAATGTYLSPCLSRAVRYPHTQASETFGYAPRVKLVDGFARMAELYRGGVQWGWG